MVGVRGKEDLVGTCCHASMTDYTPNPFESRQKASGDGMPRKHQVYLHVEKKAVKVVRDLATTRKTERLQRAKAEALSLRRLQQLGNELTALKPSVEAEAMVQPMLSEMRAEIVRRRSALATAALADFQDEHGSPPDSGVGAEISQLQAKKLRLESQLRELRAGASSSSVGRSCTGHTNEAGGPTGEKAGQCPVIVTESCSPKPAKGKGKGKAPALPALKMKPSQPCVLDVKKRSHLMCLHWRVFGDFSDEKSVAGTAFLERPSRLVSFYPGDGEELEEMDLQLAIFDRTVDVVELPSPLLEAYFGKREAKQLGQIVETAVESKPLSLIDDKRLRMLEIMLRKYQMAHKEETQQQAVFSIKRAVLQCDYDIIAAEGLSVIRTVLRHHASEGAPITSYVRQHGALALRGLQHPEPHCLIHELLKVPQLDERLECMLFESAFEEHVTECERQLAVLREAVELLHSKRSALSLFFTTVLRLLQVLGQSSRPVPSAPGFRVATLSKLSQIKSTRYQKHSLLHVALALLQEEDADMFTAENVALLSKARSLRSHTVYQNCFELVQGFHGVREIVEKGTYNTGNAESITMERRRRTIQDKKGTEIPEAPIDADDLFHCGMEHFVEQHEEVTTSLAESLRETFTSYRNFGAFLNDSSSVYPPPRNDSDARVDLVDIFSTFAEQVRSHAADVIRDNLREQLNASLNSQK